MEQASMQNVSPSSHESVVNNAINTNNTNSTEILNNYSNSPPTTNRDNSFSVNASKRRSYAVKLNTNNNSPNNNNLIINTNNSPNNNISNNEGNNNINNSPNNKINNNSDIFNNNNNLIKLEGYLLKNKNIGKGFQQRYIQIFQKVIYYRHSPTSSKFKTIYISNIISIKKKILENDKHPFQFELKYFTNENLNLLPFTKVNVLKQFNSSSSNSSSPSSSPRSSTFSSSSSSGSSPSTSSSSIQQQQQSLALHSIFSKNNAENIQTSCWICASELELEKWMNCIVQLISDNETINNFKYSLNHLFTSCQYNDNYFLKTILSNLLEIKSLNFTTNNNIDIKDHLLLQMKQILDEINVNEIINDNSKSGNNKKKIIENKYEEFSDDE
ncbi:hypothetical protein ABK040_016567 [Willaertia magna]